MKKHIFILLYFCAGIFFISNNLHSQSGWVITNPFPNTLDYLGDIYFVNSNSGYLVAYVSNGYYPPWGKIYKTTNAGLNWGLQLLDTNCSLSELNFINNLTGFAYGSKIYKTTNAGITWTNIASGHGKMCFVDSNVGFATGGYGYICKTTNGGYSWVNIPADFGQYNGMWDIYFFNYNTGIVCGDNFVIAKTTNGGLNWSEKFPRGYGIYACCKFVSDSLGYIGGNNQNSPVLKTSNQGDVWFYTSSYFNGWAFINSFDFTDYSRGFAVGGASKIFKTTDTGITWNQIDTILHPIPYHANTELNKIYFYNNTFGFIVGDNCGLIKTTNSGNNWEVLIREDTINSVFFTDTITGFCGACKGKIFITTNKGNNWVVNNSGSNYLINDIYFWNNLNGVFITKGGEVGLTSNSGNNWIIQSVNSQINLKSFVFNNNQGVITGSFGKIYKTTNTGSNWSEKPSGTNVNINGICKTPANLLFAVGDSGTILTSTNFGDNWAVIYLNTKKRLNSIGFIDNNTGFIVGDSGKVFKTINGGTNWIPLLLYESYNFNYIRFFDNNLGYILGDEAKCRKTTDGGLSWGWQSLGINQFCNTRKIFITSQTNAFIVGDNEYIFRTTDGGGQYNVGIKGNDKKIPTYFSLSQNYPNPFNPVTKIKFSLPHARGEPEGVQIVRLVIYDILGREVATLVNQQLKPGTYEYEWDGSNFASGIYFYKLTTNDFSQTRKMVLIK